MTLAKIESYAEAMLRQLIESGEVPVGPITE